MSQFSFFPQADGSDPLADALSQYRRSKKTLGQRSEREESGMQFGRAVAGLLNDLDPLSWVVSPSSVMDDIGDFSTFIDRVKTIETKKQLDSEMSSGKLTPQEMLLRQQQIEILDKMIASEAQQAAAATQEEIAEKGVVGMFGQGVKAGVTQGVVSSMRGFANVMPFDGDAFWSGAQRETGMATPEDSVSGKIGQAVGSGLFSAASFTVNPYLGTAVMGLQGYGGGIEAYDQAYQYGLTTGDYSQFEKITSGLTSAAIEAATETLGYGIASRLAKTGVAQWFAQPGARAVMGTVGKMYAGEALEEGLVPILQNGVKMTGWTGMQPAEWKEAFSQAATDAFYGGFGGFGAAAVNVPAEIVRRQQTNKLLRDAGSKYADESFVEEIAPKRAAALQAMTPEERALESDQAEQALMQAGADLGKAKENVGAVQAQLIAKQQELARARRGRDQARIQALEAEVATGEAGLATARQNAASIAADYAASQFNYLTALASMSAGAPTVQMTVDDVLSSQQYNPATSATTAQKAVEQQLTRLGFKVQYYDGGQQGDTRPAFFSPQTPDTVYLRADGNMKFSEMMGLAMHELTHWAQFNDSGLWRAMRETMDDQTMLAAATEYWQQAAGIDPQVRQSLAQIMAEAEGKPISGDDVAQLESRMGRSLLESEGAAKMIENGAAALFRGEAVPGWFGQLVTRMGLRGRSAMSALKLYRGLQEAAKNNKGYTPGKVGFTIDAAQRGLEVMRRARLQAAGAVAAPPATPQPQAAPAPATTPAPAQPAPAAPAAPAAAPAPAPAPTAAAPAPAAPAPSPAAAAPAPAATTRAAIDAASTGISAAPDQQFFAPSANEVAAAELALEQRASEDAAAGRPNPYEGVTGEEIARLMTYVDAVDGGLLPGQMVTSEQRRIAKEMRRKIRRTVGTISARAAAPRSDIGHKREKATGRYVGSPDWVGGNPAQLKKLRKILRGLAEEGESGRYWYENSSAAILEIAGGDVVEAEKIVALIALYSPNATVPANTTMALTAYYQFKAGVPINAGFGVADAKATALMAEGKMWSGIKTNSFYQNLMVNIDPSKLDPGVATMDMWMALAFDYGDKALDQGPKYQFSQREIQRLAAELGWEAHQVQAAIWTAMKGRIDPIREQLKEKELEVGIGETYEKVDPKTGKTKVLYRVKKGREYDHFRLAHKMGMEYDLKKEDIEASRYDFSDALRERMVQLSWEATPSTSTGRSIPEIHKAPLDQRREYLEAIYKVLFQNGRSVIAELAGLANGTSMIGYSAWKGDIGAGAQTFTPVATSGTGSKKAIKPEAAANLDLASNMLGFILEQDAVTYHTASYGAAKKDQNMAALQTSRPLTMQEMHSLYKALHDKFGTWDLAPAYRPDGVRIGNFTAFDDSVPTIDNKAFHDGIQEIIESLPDDFGGGSVTATTFMSVGNYLSNNWETNPNGETYLERIQAQRPVVLERVRNLRSSVEAINREFDAKYGWGAGRVFSTAPAPAAPAAATAAEPDVTGERPDDEPEGPGPTPGPGGGQPVTAPSSPSIVAARAPSRGIFDVNNPPEPKAGFDRVMAVMDSDGVVYYDTEARMHGDLVDSFPGIEDYVIDGGFIVNGKYRMNMSDGGYAAKEGGDERVAEVKAFTKRVNDPTIVGARSPSLSSFAPEWQEWFRGSKVVDEYGNPKVQFHSTSALVDGQSFDQFLPFSHFGTPTAAQDRFRAINVIKGFKSEIPRRGSRTYPVYLSIKNPLRVTDFAATNEATLLSEILSAQRRGGYLEINVDDIDDVTAVGTYDAVRKAGYDGLVYKNEFEDRGEDSYVIFDPSQAKSIFNVRPTRSPIISSARQRREDLAYQIGRRSGQVAGVARGRQQREAEVREAQREAEARARAVEETRRRAKEQKREQRVRERAKRAALAGRMQARLARLSAEIRRRQRREGERMEDFSRRALREMMREAQTASGEGYRQAKKDLSRLKREAIELINLLPPKTRSRYLPRIAELSSAAGVLKVADSVVRDMTRNEARVTFNRLRSLQQQFTSRRGIRNDTRDQAMPLIQSGMAMLGGDRLMGYTDMADMVQRIGAARQLLEEARDLYEQDREAWRDGRAERQQERADAAEALAQNIERLDELPDSRLWSTGRTAGFVGKFFAANSDIHTLAEIIDGAIDGPIHEMIARLAAGKNAMNLDRRRIDQTMDGLLQQAGYSSVDDYAQRAAGMGGVAATDVMDVMLGGQSRRITSGEAMSLAAMDDDTLALLFDENDPEFAGSPITFLRDGGKMPVRVTRQEVEAIRARLSQGQIALIDGLKAMIDADIRQRAFDVHYAQFGRMPEAIPGYYPRRRLGDSISGDTVDVNATPGNVIMTMLDNAGFTRQRVASRAPLVVDDLVRTIDGHVDQGLRLIHLSDPLRFGITVLRDANVKSAMESRLGARSNDQMRKLLMNGVGLSGRPTGDFIDSLNSNVSGALLLINPKTWFRQLGGIFRLASEFDMGDWASGSRSSIALTPAQRSDLIDRIEQDSGYFFDRHRRSQVGLFAGIIGDPRQNRERMMVMLRAVGSNLRSAVDEATQANFRSMLEDLNAGRSNVLTILRSFDWALRGIDRQVMLAGYMSARQSLSRTDPAMAEQDAHLAAIALAERAFRRTQNVSDPMDDTVFAAEQKFNKGYGRLLFPFSSDPLKAFNQARRAVANPDARAGTAFGITANILWSAAANPLSVGLAGLATGLWASDDEDDKLLKQAIVNQQAQRAMERAAGDLVGSAFGYGGLILNDVYQAYRAYQDGYAPDAGIQIMPLQVANEVLRNFAAGEYGAMAGDVATLAGIPVTTPIESIRRDIARVTPTPEKIRDALLAKKRGSGLTADEERRLKAAQQQVRLNKLQTAE